MWGSGSKLQPYEKPRGPPKGRAAGPKVKEPTGNGEEPRGSLAPSARRELWTERRGTAAAEAARTRCGARGPGVRDAGGPPAPLRPWPAAPPHLAGRPSGPAFSCAPRSGPSWPAPATKVKPWGWGPLRPGAEERGGAWPRGSWRARRGRRGRNRTPLSELTWVVPLASLFPPVLSRLHSHCLTLAAERSARNLAVDLG